MKVKWGADRLVWNAMAMLVYFLCFVRFGFYRVLWCAVFVVVLVQCLASCLCCHTCCGGASKMRSVSIEFPTGLAIGCPDIGSVRVLCVVGVSSNVGAGTWTGLHWVLSHFPATVLVGCYLSCPTFSMNSSKLSTKSHVTCIFRYPPHIFSVFSS